MPEDNAPATDAQLGNVEIGSAVPAGTTSQPTSQPTTEPSRPLGAPAIPDAGGYVWGTGRRKSAVARVRVRPKKGDTPEFKVNGKDVEAFFSEPQHRKACLAALDATNTREGVDVFVKVHGGGITGQSGAVLLGVARALKGFDPTVEQALRDNGFLTRDPREVERKKYGQRGARRRFQFSKR